MNENLGSASRAAHRLAEPLATFATATALALTIAAPASAQTERAAAHVLTLQEARARAARVSDLAYDLTFKLDDESPDYSGSVTATFTLADAETDLTLDFFDGTVASVDINDAAVDTHYNGFFLTLPAAALHAGPNRIEVRFTHPYSSDGSGLYRFQDPEDGRDYLFTDFEPYDQNRLFPSFDQPDLKARYASIVTVPAAWQVISNVAESEVTETGAEKTWVFPQTLPISTYVFALHAGEYHVWESAAGDVPLRLFARESMAQYVEPDDWFLITRQGFQFFENYFDIPYPFGKYDQVIVPHFNAGAMENVGAVTFNELYLRRGAYTRQDRRAIASVLLHELAHMWFGDLVTMDWWNGLWLNESFATLMSVLAMVEGTEFTAEWLESYRATIDAYAADERDTTHAIELPIADTDGAFANFDDITYEKGSATLIQLNYLVGPETFRRGVGDYLQAHAYGNTGIEDFLGAISAAAGQDLDRWAEDWLLAPGTNTLDVELECRDGAILSLALLQGSPEAWPTLRTHRTQVGLYDFDGGEVAVRTLPVTYSGPRTNVAAAEGQRCPDMVYANHGAWDFVRVRLDPGALPVLSENLHAFEDPLTRLMLWHSAWDMALDARLPLTRYFEFALANLGREADAAIERHVIVSVWAALNYLVQVDPGPGGLGTWGPRVESYLWRELVASDPGSDRQLQMLDRYTLAVTSAAGVDHVAQIVNGNETLPDGLAIDQDRRWSLLQVLAEHGHGETAELLAAERTSDPSDAGRLRALAIEVAAPDVAVKQHWVASLIDPARVTTLAEFRAAARALFPRSQHELEMRFVDEVLAAVLEQSGTRDPQFLTVLIAGLARPVCSRDYVDRVAAALAAGTDLHPILERGLKDARFEAARCLRIAAAFH
jgi:aminopeptidase N